MPRKTNDFPARLSRFHRALAAWYARCGRRDLPWRNTDDPYHVYVSEIMLQQTQVKTVLDRYYVPFLKRFPALGALAQAPREAVMKQWEGLGYYTRAGNLHAAAQQCGGALPDSPEGLLALPGIGRNTANAVACFGFGAAVPIMEANVKRVLSRVFALKAPKDDDLWEKAALLLDRKNAFDYNQAMMDIGALVCTKRAPRCGECPLAELCAGKASPQAYPAPKQAKITPVRKRAIVAFVDGQGRYYLTRRGTKLLNGLYGFMEYEDAGEVRFDGRKFTLGKARLAGAVTQVYSHFRLEAKVYVVTVAKLPPGTHVSLKDMASLPLSKADHKIVALLRERRPNAA